MIFYKFMRYLTFLLLLFAATATLELANFNAKANTSAIHQLTNTHIITGNQNGNLQFYTSKGQLLNTERTFHKSKIIALDSFQVNTSTYSMSADSSGAIAIWDEANLLISSIDLQKVIVSAVMIETDQKDLIAVNLGAQILIYEALTLNLKRVVSGGGGQFKKIETNRENNIFYLLETGGQSAVYDYNWSAESAILMLKRQSIIYDFSIGKLNQGKILYIINSQKHLEIYQFTQNSIVNQNLDHEESLILHSKYIALAPFKNSRGAPMVAAIKSGHQIEFFTGFEVSLFLQFNSEIALLKSSLENSLLLVTASDQVTILLMNQQDQGQEVWIILFIILLLVTGLYLCCGDCCPGIYEKWQQQTERKEIEMQLYKKRTELDNF